MEKSREQKNTIIVCVMTAFITTFMGSALNLSVPALEEEFRVGAQTVGWVVTIYMLTCAALAVPFGRLADRISRELILRAGLLIFSVASAAAVISLDMKTFLSFRVVQGIGASMIFSTNIAILAGAFSKEKRGKVLGYSTCATYTGLSAGPVLGGILNQNLGWRAIFIATAVVSAAAFYGAVFKLPKRGAKGDFAEKCNRTQMDYMGNILFVVSVVMIMYGLSALKTTAAAPVIMACGTLLFVIFIKVELRAPNPVIEMRIFKKNWAFVFSNLAAMFNYGSNFAVSYLISIYLQVVKGMSSQWAGLVLVINTVIMALLSPVTGRFSDRLSPYRMSAAGMGLCSAALILFACMPADSSLIRIILTLILSGLGFALFSTPNTNAVMSCVERKDYGVASSVLATMRSMGHTASMAAVTAVVGIYIGKGSLRDASTELIMKTMHVSFTLFASLCILGIFMAVKRKV